MGEQSERGDEELRREVALLAERRFLRTQAVVQDLSDSLLAISDIRGELGGWSRQLHMTFLPPLAFLGAGHALPAPPYSLGCWACLTGSVVEATACCSGRRCCLHGAMHDGASAHACG